MPVYLLRLDKTDAGYGQRRNPQFADSEVMSEKSHFRGALLAALTRTQTPHKPHKSTSLELVRVPYTEGDTVKHHDVSHIYEQTTHTLISTKEKKTDQKYMNLI